MVDRGNSVTWLLFSHPLVDPKLRKTMVQFASWTAFHSVKWYDTVLHTALVMIFPWNKQYFQLMVFAVKFLYLSNRYQFFEHVWCIWWCQTPIKADIKPQQPFYTEWTYSELTVRKLKLKCKSWLDADLFISWWTDELNLGVCKFAENHILTCLKVVYIFLNPHTPLSCPFLAFLGSLLEWE